MFIIRVETYVRTMSLGRFNIGGFAGVVERHRHKILFLVFHPVVGDVLPRKLVTHESIPVKAADERVYLTVVVAH